MKNSRSLAFSSLLTLSVFAPSAFALEISDDTIDVTYALETLNDDLEELASNLALSLASSSTGSPAIYALNEVKGESQELGYYVFRLRELVAHRGNEADILKELKATEEQYLRVGRRVSSAFLVLQSSFVRFFSDKLNTAYKKISTRFGYLKKELDSSAE